MRRCTGLARTFALAALLSIALGGDARAVSPRVPPPVGEAAAVDVLPVDTPAWQLAWGRLDAEHPNAIAYTSHSGTLTVQKLGGEKLWSSELGAFAYAAALCDLDGDGRAEVIAGTAAGEVRAHDARGALRWSARPGGQPLALACGRFAAAGSRARQLAVGTTNGEVVLYDAKGAEQKRLPFPFAWRKPPAIRALDAADTDGDGIDELAVANFERAYGVVDARTGRARWQRQTREPHPWIYAIRFVDFAGDGRPEVVVGGRNRIVAADADGVRFEAAAGRSKLGNTFPRLAPVPLGKDGKRGNGVAVLFGPELSVFDATGALRYGTSTAQYWFNAIAPSPDGAREVLLGSITGADQNVYRVRFGAARADQLATLLDPPGPRRDILRSLLALRQRVLGLPSDPQAGARRYYVHIDGDASTSQKMRGWLREQRAFRAAYPYENLVFHGNVTFATRGRHAKPLAELIALANEAEHLGFLHILTVGHSLDDENDVEDVKAWLERTPKTCLGVRVSELSIELGMLPAGADRRSPRLERELTRFYAPLLDLAAQRGVFAHLLMKRNFWVLAPASRRYHEHFFAPSRRRPIVALEEGSNTRARENALMARVGLWRAGLIGAWGVRVINDDLRLDRFFEYQSAEPHHMLRSLVSAAAAGATHFSVKPRFLLRDLRGLRGHQVGPNLVMNDEGLASLDLFLHLLGKGLVAPPTPDAIAGLAPIEWRFVEPAASFARESRAWSLASEQGERPAGAFTGVAARRPTGPAFVNRELLGIEFHGLAFYPENPYGLPTIVPDWAPPRGRALRTDGERVEIDGEWRSGSDAAKRVVATFREAAAALPVRVEGAHWNATRRPDGSYRVTLLDPDNLEPRARTARLVTRRRITGLRDVLGAADVRHGEREATIPLEAGSIRILDVRLAAESES